MHLCRDQSVGLTLVLFMWPGMYLAFIHMCVGGDTWTALNKLKHNPDRTQFIVFSSKVQCEKLSSHFPVNCLESLFDPSNIVKNKVCGFHFSEHAKKTCKVCFL